MEAIAFKTGFRGINSPEVFPLRLVCPDRTVFIDYQLQTTFIVNTFIPKLIQNNLSGLVLCQYIPLTRHVHYGIFPFPLDP